jgi:hypothetical protein
MMAGKIKKRRKERIAADKWVVGERLTKAGRARGRRRRTMRKVEKVFKKGGKITTQKPGKKDGKYSLTAEHKKSLGMKQKIRKGAKEVTLTKGGAYAKYGKKSGAAKSFRKTFKDQCVGGKKSFSWDGRSYSCAKAGPAKKAAKPVAKTAAKPGVLKSLAKRALKAGILKKAPAPKGGKQTFYQKMSGGKTAVQHREERIEARRKKSEAARAKRRNR